MEPLLSTGIIENILELTMLDFNGAYYFCWDLRVITHMNNRPSCEEESGEGILGGNHVVGCSRINQVRFRPREERFQGMPTYHDLLLVVHHHIC